MTKPQRIKFFGTWNRCCQHLQTSAGYTKSECEAERQAMLKQAGATADQNGRYSANTLDNDGISTCLDFMETSILGLPNKRRRSRSKIYAIERLGLDDALLNKVAHDTYKVNSWRDLSHEQLIKFQFTAKRLARQKTKQEA